MSAASSIPTLATPRLQLRGLRVEDFAEYAAMWGDPLVTRYLGGRASTQEEAWVRLLRNAGQWALLGFGYWGIWDEAGRFVGDVGFAELRRQLEPSLEGSPEIGWTLAAWAHGKGLATEAARAAVAWADGHLASARTVCAVRPDNRASIRVAEKCGYREYARAAYRSEALILLERTAEHTRGVPTLGAAGT